MQKASKLLLIVFLLLLAVIGFELAYLFFSNKQAKLTTSKPKGIDKTVYKGLQNYVRVPSIQLFLESEVKTTVISISFLSRDSGINNGK